MRIVVKVVGEDTYISIKRYAFSVIIFVINNRLFSLHENVFSKSFVFAAKAAEK